MTEDWKRTHSLQLFTSVFNTFSTELEGENMGETEKEKNKCINIIWRQGSFEVEAKDAIRPRAKQKPNYGSFCESVNERFPTPAPGHVSAKCQVIRFSSCTFYNWAQNAEYNHTELTANSKLILNTYCHLSWSNCIQMLAVGYDFKGILHFFGNRLILPLPQS